MAAAHVFQSSGSTSTHVSTVVPTPPIMAAAQAGRLKNALLVVAVHDATDITTVNVKLEDPASGAIVGQLDGLSSARISTAAGLICLVPTASSGSIVRVFNPATGGITNITAGPTAAHSDLLPQSTYVFAHVPATKEYKLLRIVTSKNRENKRKQSCDILTVVGGGFGQQRWRPAPSPPVLVSAAIPRHRAVAAGFAHFLTPTDTIGYDGVVSFDMAKEEWRPSLLQGPLPSKNRNCHHDSLSLVELNGCLAFVDHDYVSYCMDMWVLEDIGKGKWSQIESLQLGSIMRGWEEEPNKGLPLPWIAISRPMREIFAQPLMVLDDGRIAFWVRFPNNSLRLYDPKTRKYEEVEMGIASSIVGLYRPGES